MTVVLTLKQQEDSLKQNVLGESIIHEFSSTKKRYLFNVMQHWVPFLSGKMEKLNEFKFTVKVFGILRGFQLCWKNLRYNK
jgi:hypothetical protein